tara:strand:- start:63 stop:512 length:450 start_codon:yes stop_codon:yes gene_type:complete
MSAIKIPLELVTVDAISGVSQEGVKELRLLLVVKLKLVGFDKAVFVVFCKPEVRVTVITSPAKKLLVGLKVTCVVVPPEYIPSMIPVFLPLIRMFPAVAVEVLTAALKFKTMLAFKAILLALTTGVLLLLGLKVICAIVVKNGLTKRNR